jgi:uncharacterized protein (UPF0335 family)
MTDAYAITADELRQFVEVYEQLDAEKRAVSDQQKDVMAEAKARGYAPKYIRAIVQLRKRRPEEVAEEEAEMEVYRKALGLL